MKALAEQTAKATGEIGQQLSSSPGGNAGLGRRDPEDPGTIEQPSDISTVIAAVEISRNMQ